MRKIAILAISYLAVGSASLCGAADITYDVNLTIGPPPGTFCAVSPGNVACASATVTGYIETDGTTGTLALADIVGWNLQLAVPAGVGGLSNAFTGYDVPPEVVSSGVGYVDPDPGLGLSATSTQLLFDFSGPDAFALVDYSDGSFLCFVGPNNTNCFGYPLSYGVDYFETDGFTPSGFSELSGTQAIGATSEGNSVTPEPPSLLLLSTGLAGFAGVALGKHKARKFLRLGKQPGFRRQ